MRSYIYTYSPCLDMCDHIVFCTLVMGRLQKALFVEYSVNIRIVSGFFHLGVEPGGIVTPAYPYCTTKCLASWGAAIHTYSSTVTL